MVQEWPLVSVCMITYNHENYIAEALDSIFAQDYKGPIEVVIGEDASTDGTRKVAESYVQRYPGRVKLLPSDQRYGMTQNFFRTIYACSGKYLALLEGDDYWVDQSKLTKQVTALEENPQYVYCYSDAVKIDPSGKYVGDVIVNHKRDHLTAADIIGGFWSPTLTTIIRRQELFDVVAVLEKDSNVLNLDWVTFSLLSEKGLVGYVKTEPSAYRQHAGGVYSKKTIEYKLTASLESHKYLKPLLKPENRKYLDSTIKRLYNNYLYGLLENKAYLKFFVTEVKLCMILTKRKRFDLIVQSLKDCVHILRTN